MNPDDVEGRLHDLARNWPARSVADVVVARLPDAISKPRSRKTKANAKQTRWRRLAAAALPALAAAALLAGIFFAADLWRSPRLFAQVQEALRRAQTAHIVIEVAPQDGKSEPARGEVWFDRQKGFRCQHDGETVVDDGKSNWSWRAAPDGEVATVIVRESADGTAAIAALLDLARSDGGDPKRMEDLDEGAQRAFALTPPGAEPANRLVFWLDGEDRPARLSWQNRHGETWRELRRATIAYDVEISPAKLVADYPAGARSIDVREGLAARFPMMKAIARREVEGIEFAVHEAEWLENRMAYFVTSARGTEAFLKEHPPIRRRINLNRTALDVARHVVGSGTQSDFHTMGLMNVEEGGVHYCWWIAAPRQYFRYEKGERRDEATPYPIDLGGGVVAIPLVADLADPKLRDARGVNRSIRASLQCAAYVDSPRSSLASVAARLRDDARIVAAILGGEAEMPLVGASLRDNTVRLVSLEELGDEEYAAELERLYEQLLQNDELQDVPPE